MLSSLYFASPKIEAGAHALASLAARTPRLKEIGLNCQAAKRIRLLNSAEPGNAVCLLETAGKMQRDKILNCEETEKPNYEYPARY